jgi:DNA-binding transcriptional LysR family regulator
MRLGMEIHELRYFLALADTLNFTRAAEACHVTQPALTRAIQNLEEKLGGGPLVNRERGNTHLTELGRIMRPYFEQAIARLEEASATAKRYNRGEASTLTLGLMCTIGPTRMIEFFSAFHRDHPEIQLYLKDAPAAQIEAMLASGELDVAIYCKATPIDEKFHLLKLYEERFMLAVPPSHPFASHSQVPFKDLDGQRYLHRANCEYNDTIEELFSEHGVMPVYPYESERDDWIQSLVRAGLGCSAIPEFAVSAPGLQLVPLVEPELKRTLYLVSVRGRPHTAPVGAIVIAARQYAWPGMVPPA